MKQSPTLPFARRLSPLLTAPEETFLLLYGTFGFPLSRQECRACYFAKGMLCAWMCSLHQQLLLVISKSYTLGCAAGEELIFLPFPLFGAQQNICAVTS